MNESAESIKIERTKRTTFLTVKQQYEGNAQQRGSHRVNQIRLTYFTLVWEYLKVA